MGARRRDQQGQPAHQLEATLATDGLALREAKAGPEAEAGESLSLRPAAELAVLLAGLERSLPWIF